MLKIYVCCKSADVILDWSLPISKCFHCRIEHSNVDYLPVHLYSLSFYVFDKKMCRTNICFEHHFIGLTDLVL